MESDRAYDQIRSFLASGDPPRGIYSKFRAKPELNFRLNRIFDCYSKLIAYDFIVDFYHLSDASILEIGIKSGCIDIAVRVSSPIDCFGRDFRSAFLVDPDWHQLFEAYDVKKITFHAFPNASNFDVFYLIGSSGVPYGSSK